MVNMPILPEQEIVIASMKDDRLSYSISIFSENNQEIGRLIPITRHLAIEEWLLEMLSIWRKSNMESFLTKFDINAANVSSFLSGVTIPDPARLLFIAAEQGRAIGNIGLCNIEAQSAEIDNVLRGFSAQNPDFMYRSAVSLIKWAHFHLGVIHFYLHVLENNVKAIRLYKKLGFCVQDRMPLWYKARPDGYQLIRSQEDGAIPHSVSLVRMILLPSKSDLDIWKES